MHFIGISGSLRSASYNTALLRAAFEDLPRGVTAEIASLEDIPMYDWEYEQARGFPSPVAKLRDRVAAADGIIFATPEYNFSVTGALKNVIDWLSRGPLSPIDFKPAAIIGAGGGGGTLRSQQHLRDILQHNSLRVLAEPQVMVPRARMYFDGIELTDDGIRSALREMVDGLIALIEHAAESPPPNVRGSVLIAAPDANTAARLARQAGQRGYRTLATTSATDAALVMSGRVVAAMVIGEALDEEEQTVIRESMSRHHPNAPVLIANDPSLIGAALDDELRFQLAGR